MTKQQLIDVLSPALIANGATAADAQSVLETYTVSQLEKLILKQTPAPTPEEIADAIRRVEKIMSIQAERDLDFIDHEIKIGMAHTEKQRAEKEAAEPLARELFQSVCRVNNLSLCEANFQVLFGLGLLDSPSTAEQIPQRLNHEVSLAPASGTELDQFAAERAEQHNEHLRGLSPYELRLRVQQEAAAKYAKQTREAADEHLEAIRQQDSAMGYPPLPVDITSEQIRNMPSERLKYTIKRFGNAAVTARLRGVA